LKIPATLKATFRLRVPGRLLGGLLGILLAGALTSCASRTVDQMAAAEWVEVRSDNFIIYSEVGDRAPRRMIEQLETFRSFVIDHMQLEGVDNPLPFRIVLLQGSDSIQAVVPERGVFGMYQATYQGGLALVDVSARAEDGTSTLDITYTPSGPIYRKRAGMRFVSIDGVLHEYVHHLLANDTRRRYPLWFNEGYAEYLSTFHLGAGSRAVVGAPPMHRVEALQQARWMPLEALFRAQGYETAHGYGGLYAQAWAVVHYMMSAPERAAQTDIFLDLLADGSDVEQSFETAYGIALKAMSARARSKVRSRGKWIHSTRIEMEVPLFSVSETRLLGADEAEALMADMLMSFSGKNDVARQHLTRALKLNPANTHARAVLGGLERIADRYQAAEEILMVSRELESDSPEILAQRGHLYIDQAIDAAKLGGNNVGQLVAQGRQYYERALVIDADNAEAWVGLGRSYLLGDPNNNARGFEALFAAYQLLPTNLETQLLLGHLYLSSANIPQARQHYQEVLQWSRVPDLTRQARSMIEALDRQARASSLDGALVEPSNEH
jgi:tetratricopeptide (TPR) repeat protein